MRFNAGNPEAYLHHRMVALILSITLSTYLVLCFRFFKRFHIRNLHAIVFNYLACVLTGILVTGIFPSWHAIDFDWFPYAVWLGCSYFFIFNLMAYVASNLSVTLTSVASKLSMVIPVAAAVVLYHDSLTWLKVLALLVAIPAVYMSAVTDQPEKKGYAFRSLLLAFAIFIGSGINDSVVNYASVKLMKADEFSYFNIMIFTFAALSGVVTITFRTAIKREPVPLKSVAAGIALGIPNYFSLLYLMKALNMQGWASSAVFPINNMGIVVLTAFSAWLLFHEKLSRMNLAGMLLALAAIALILLS